MRCRRRSDAHAGRRTAADRPALCTGDDGAVTVEAAMALGTLVAVTAAAVAAVAAVAAGVRCTDAARELVRQAARGDADRGRAAAAALAPGDAQTELRIEGDTVIATVRTRPVGLLPLSVTGSAAAVAEPGLTGTGSAASSGPRTPPSVSGPEPGPEPGPGDETAGAPAVPDPAEGAAPR
ncbi:hypothetical protein Ae168Ps1_3678c [Pseudonocardia sp. Ae168_Ps1]|nr:hypothetical protein Ae150APs1_3655c [Pseudonocardia sp. Ae150A_Ps1]OLL81272.1 hypothetical protein Ae168Ps1_3678c [Pseudonocardia sp. Ae168_Ps1]OLL84614.1 hypothetical protein Ae263Ps1_1669 [Pseudonocardia sp. Ae263_Ps1]OLL95367.1 hypothetical protein Ae356Ps1_5264c [Pseudonocardia sp. Ae356_Ps1]